MVGGCERLTFGGQEVQGLDFGDELVRLAPGDKVVLALPPWVAVSLVPDLEAPTEHRAIVNAHFRVCPPVGLQPMIGVINGTIEWIFSFRDRLAVTISAGDRLLEADARDAGLRVVAGSGSGNGHARTDAAMANHQGATGHLRGAAGGKQQTAGD